MAKTAVLGMALAVALWSAGCAAEEPEALDDSPAEEAVGEDGEELPDRDDYVRAIAGSAMAGEDDELRLDNDQAVCVGEAYVELIGLDELRQNVSPDEIRFSAEFSASSWDISLTDEEGAELFDEVMRCAPDIGSAIAEGVADGIGQVMPPDVELDIDCLAGDTTFLRSFGGKLLAHGDQLILEEDEAGAIFDWLAACTDMRAFTVGILSAGGAPPGAATCMETRMTDDLIERFWTAAFLHADDPEAMETSPVAEEFAALAEECADAAAPTES